MIVAIRMQRGLRMPFLLDRCRIQPQGRRTSSIRQSFGRDGAVPCRHGRVARDSRSAGIPSTILMRLVPHRGAPLSTPPASR